MSLKVLGISASPRREGNSDLLLRQALSGAQQAGAGVELLRLQDYRIEGCRECYNCSANGNCSTPDDYQSILTKMLEADRLIVATPVFFMTVSAQAKLLIDRGQCLWVRYTVLHRPLFEPKRDRRGLLIAVGGSRSRKQFDCVRQPVQACFKSLEVDYLGSLCINQVDEKGAILKRPEALEQAFRLGGLLAGADTPLPQRPLEIEMF
jgi:multimeric flavodoxin WrbA